MAIYEKAKPLGVASLNYEVVGGTTAPTTFRKENTIWVNTSIAIGEHTFNYKNPYISLVNLLPAIDGVSGFISSYATAATDYKKYSNSSLKLTGNTSTPEVSAVSANSYHLIPSHKYYARVEIFQTTAHKNSDFYFPIAEPRLYGAKSVSAPNTWTIISEVADRSSFSEGDYTFRLDYNNQNESGSMWFDGIMLIDLTAAFGAGNEPTASWCDSNIPYFTGTLVLTDIGIGDVWIQTDIDKAPVSFNAIKKNELMVYPYKLKRWDGSKWKTVNGSLYQGSTITQIYSAEEVIYENGKFVDDYSSYTATVASSSNGSLALNSDHMLIKCNNGGHCYVGFDKELIAPSDYTKMCLTFIPVNSWNNSNTTVMLSENFSDKWANHVKCTQTTAGTPVTLTMPLTTRTDAFWWGVGSNWDTYNSPEVKIIKIWFE